METLVVVLLVIDVLAVGTLVALGIRALVKRNRARRYPQPLLGVVLPKEDERA